MSRLWWMMQRSTSGAHLVCAGLRFKHFTCTRLFWAFNARFGSISGVELQLLILFWRWTPELGRELALNASLRRLSLCKVWTIIYWWKALDVYFPMKLEACHFEFCSSRKSTLSAGRSESNSISSPFSAWIRFLLSSFNFSQKNTWNYRKTHNS